MPFAIGFLSKHKSSILAIISAFFSLNCFNNSESTPTEPTIEGKTYKNPIVGISLTAPQSWSVTMGNASDGLIVSMQNSSGYPNLNVITAEDNIKSGDSAIIKSTMKEVCDAYPASFSKITVQPTTSIIKIGDELVGEVSVEGILKDDTETYHYSQLLFFHRSFYFVITYTDLADDFSDNSQDYSEIKNSIALY